MTNKEATELWGADFVIKVMWLRKLFNAQSVEIVNKKGRTFLAEGEPKCQPLTP